MIFTCRLVEVCDARIGVARVQFVVNAFGPGRNTRFGYKSETEEQGTELNIARILQ